jgi:hypothetical protein
MFTEGIILSQKCCSIITVNDTRAFVKQPSLSAIVFFQTKLLAPNGKKLWLGDKGI